MPGLYGTYEPPVPSKVIFGQGRGEDLPSELDWLGSQRVMVLSGRSIAERTNTVKRVEALLGDKCMAVYSNLPQRAPLATAVEATQIALDNGVDTLVGVGGSTISDAARMIGVMMAEGLTSEDALRDRGHEGGGNFQSTAERASLPLQVSIPTTLSAGEFNTGGGNVLDDQAGHKIRVRHPGLYAHLIVLDPDMTEGTPDWLWLSSGVKALDHCIERLYCRGSQPATDATTQKAAELLFRHLPQSREEMGNSEARLGCLMGAWMSMMGAPSVGSGLSHAIGHVIGVKYSVGHGYTSCVTQPYVMEFNRPASADKQAMLAQAAGLDTRGMSDDVASEAVAEVVDQFILELGMPHRLRELEIPHEDLPEIARMTLEDGPSRNNPVQVTSPEELLPLLEKAW
ncbi:MAG: iron-containing alcohol dehydrogenase [Chloroflexi bacterium]|nr:iron-containing alcohol dehydrogenase [Chloroflexota bacterium]